MFFFLIPHPCEHVGERKFCLQINKQEEEEKEIILSISRELSYILGEVNLFFKNVQLSHERPLKLKAKMQGKEKKGKKRRGGKS